MPEQCRPHRNIYVSKYFCKNRLLAIHDVINKNNGESTLTLLYMVCYGLF